MGLLRVSRKGELEGIDNYEHGIGAYPEYALKHSAIPVGSDED